MKRKIVEQGGLTLMVSLPRQWAKDLNLKKGDEVEVEETKKTLIIKADKEPETTRIRLDISNLDAALVYRYIYSAYNIGYDELELYFENKETTNIKRSTRIKTIELIQKIVSDLIGYEIIDQKETSCLVKDLGSISGKEFDNVLRRIFLLTLEFIQDCKRFLDQNNFESLSFMRTRQDNIDKFIKYCLRILNKRGYKESNKTTLYYLLLAELERTIDLYAWICDERNISKTRTDKEVIELIESINDYFHLFYKSFYTLDKKMTNEIIEKRRNNFDKINESRKRVKREDIVLVDTLANINNTILDMAELKITITL